MSKPNTEERVIRVGTVQYRADVENDPNATGRTIQGYAALFNSRTELWPGFSEEIAPGAFKNALQNSDIRALFNHEPNLILARSPGTMEVWEDETGLWYRFEAPNTTLGNDLLEMIKRGDVSQSSFAFTVKSAEETRSEDGGFLRRITEVRALYDVSPVTYPAYNDTSVSVRAKFEADQKPKYTGNENRSRLLDLYAKQLK